MHMITNVRRVIVASLLSPRHNDKSVRDVHNKIYTDFLGITYKLYRHDSNLFRFVTNTHFLPPVYILLSVAMGNDLLICAIIGAVSILKLLIDRLICRSVKINALCYEK
jgi:hypothetical protein